MKWNKKNKWKLEELIKYFKIKEKGRKVIKKSIFYSFK
jgi:hypothetical protein